MNTETVRERTKELLDGFNRLHSALEGLPESRCAPLRKLVEQGTQECQNLGSITRNLENSLADLHLSTAHARFELSAMLMDLRDAHKTAHRPKAWE